MHILCHDAKCIYQRGSRSKKLTNNDLEDWGSGCGVRKKDQGIRAISEVKLRLVNKLDVGIKEKEIGITHGFLIWPAKVQGGIVQFTSTGIS